MFEPQSTQKIPTMKTASHPEMGNGLSASIVITPTTDNAEFYEEFVLGEKEKAILQKSWTLSEQFTTKNLGQRLFEKIFARSKECQQIFGLNPANFYKHLRAFMNLMEYAVSSLDCNESGEKFWRTCFEIGRRHAPFTDFKNEYWNIFKASMLECVVEWEGHRCNHRTTDAWAKLLSYITRNMKNGYDLELAKTRVTIWLSFQLI